MSAVTESDDQPALAKKEFPIIPLSQKTFSLFSSKPSSICFSSWKNQEDKEEERKRKVQAGVGLPWS